MGETAKILCPDKKVIVPDAEAGCSLADSCDPEELRKFVEAHPGYTVISYVNSSAAVKTLTDIVVTSGNARRIIESLPKEEKIIFGPDKNLGAYINAECGREMLLWPGACHVHSRFSLDKTIELKKAHPEARLLVHPECQRPLQLIADKVGSTAALLDFCRNSDAKEFIVATEPGIFHEMQKACPSKSFIAAPAEDEAGGCNVCEYMKYNTLQKLCDALENEAPEIIVDEATASKALRPIKRMLELSK